MKVICKKIWLLPSAKRLICAPSSAEPSFVRLTETYRPVKYIRTLTRHPVFYLVFVSFFIHCFFPRRFWIFSKSNFTRYYLFNFLFRTIFSLYQKKKFHFGENLLHRWYVHYTHKKIVISDVVPLVICYIIHISHKTQKIFLHIHNWKNQAYTEKS